MSSAIKWRQGPEDPLLMVSGWSSIFQSSADTILITVVTIALTPAATATKPALPGNGNLHKTILGHHENAPCPAAQITARF